jgi:hypothetical protein
MEGKGRARTNAETTPERRDPCFVAVRRARLEIIPLHSMISIRTQLTAPSKGKPLRGRSVPQPRLGGESSPPDPPSSKSFLGTRGREHGGGNGAAPGEIAGDLHPEQVPATPPAASYRYGGMQCRRSASYKFSTWRRGSTRGRLPAGECASLASNAGRRASASNSQDRSPSTA